MGEPVADLAGEDPAGIHDRTRQGGNGGVPPRPPRADEGEEEGRGREASDQNFTAGGVSTAFPPGAVKLCLGG